MKQNSDLGQVIAVTEQGLLNSSKLLRSFLKSFEDIVMFFKRQNQFCQQYVPTAKAECKKENPWTLLGTVQGQSNYQRYTIHGISKKIE